jgi:hypothetical protein
MERAPKKARNDDHQFYLWNDSNFERHPTTLVVEDESKETLESEETQHESDYNPRYFCDSKPNLPFMEVLTHSKEIFFFLQPFFYILYNIIIYTVQPSQSP